MVGGLTSPVHAIAGMQCGRHRLPAVLRCLVAALAFVQNASSQVLPFRTFTIDDGLPSNQIRAICQDGRGYLWIGTLGGGMTTYDGTTFRTLTPHNGLPSMNVWSLAPSRLSDDAVWAGTWGGLCNASLRGITMYRPRDTTLSRTLFAVYEDFDGRVWCGTSAGVQILERGDSMLVPFSRDTTFGHVVGICQSSDSTIYIGSWNGLWLYRRDMGIKRLNVGRNDLVEVVLAVYVDGNDTLWVSRRDRVLLRYSGDVLIDSMPIPHGYFHRFAEDPSGDVWGASSQGVARIIRSNSRGKKVVWYNVENGLPESAHRAVFVDREANLWLGAAFMGLTRLSSVRTMSVLLKNIPDHPALAKCIQDSRGRYWIAATNGIWEVWNKPDQLWRRHFHPIQASPHGSVVTPRCLDRKGNLWLSYEGGLRCYRIERIAEHPSQLSRLKELRSGHEIPTGSVLTAVADKDGNLWVGISGVGLVAVRDAPGSARIAGHDWYAYFPERVIRSLFVDSQGRLWIGGTNTGVAVLHARGEDVTSDRLTDTDGLPGNHVRSICETPDGLIWVGCSGGVAAIASTADSPRVVTTVTSSDGLLDNAVLSLLPSSDSGVWVGTMQGLQLYSPDQRAVLPAEPEFMRRPAVSLGHLPDGRLWCLGYDGLRVFETDATERKPLPPPTYIVRFEVNDRTVHLPADGPLILAHDENNCTIEYGGVSLRAAGFLQYKYRLLPTDDAWHGPTLNRTVALPALQPGTYTFEVAAIGPTGLQSIRSASVSFTINPPLWRTWWFIVFIGGVVLALAVLGYRYRVNQLLAIERLRLRISSDLHDELASNLSSIALFGSIVNEGTTSRDEHRLVERMTALAQDSLASLRHIIWAIEPKDETLEAFLTRLNETLTPTCRAQQIALTVGTLTQHDRNVRLKPDQRQHLWLLLKEAVTNAVKHSRASRVAIQASVYGNSLRIVVADDGIGFDGAATSQGRGLGTMRMRAHLLRGTLQIASAHGKGTQLILQIER